MPHYFVDIHNSIRTEDDEGFDVPDLNQARIVAVETLIDVARIVARTADYQAYAVIRDDGHNRLEDVSLTIAFLRPGSSPYDLATS